MYVVVVGGGRVGYYLAKALLAEGNEVLIIEKNAIICANIVDEMGSICLRGDGCEAAILAEAGTDRADMLAAVTGDDEDNLIACQVAKHKFHVPRTIARIRNPRNEDLFRKLGIDVTVSSTNIILEAIEEVVPTHLLTHLLTIGAGEVELVEVKIAPGATTIGRPIKELQLPAGSLVCLIIRGLQKPLLPAADMTLQEGDHVIAAIRHESEEAFRAALRGAGPEVQH